MFYTVKIYCNFFFFYEEYDVRISHYLKMTCIIHVFG